jgi:glutathione S-transferase|tara:strand:- start:26 stop:607 length:582 start_codon:yes stop_codon:yes gene_type:complete
MAIKQAGIICELREVLLRDKPKEMLLVSPKGTVPVLQLCDGTILEESLAIMHWALEYQDPHNWLKNIDQSNTLLTALHQSFKGTLDRYKYFVNYPQHPQIHYRKQGENFLVMLENKLSDNLGKGLCDTRTTFTDIAVFPFVRQFAFVDKVWFDQSSYVLLKQWLDRHLESDLFLSVMHKGSPWKLGNNALYLE